MAHTACLACLIITVNGYNNNKKEALEDWR
jgi:hypothetical protein